MRRSCKIFVTTASILIGLELFIFYVIGDEPIPVKQYPFVFVDKPELFNGGEKPTNTAPVRGDEQAGTGAVSNFVPSTTKQPVDIVCEPKDKVKANYFQIHAQPINKMDYDVIINSHTSCDEGTFLLVVVHSRLNNTDKRTLIRDTWGSVAMGNKWPGYDGQLPTIKLVFLFGINRNDSENTKIRDESNRYGDVIQYDFIDDYRNMTYKNLMGLKWILAHCSRVPFILKIDDDIFANIPAIVKMLRKQRYRRRTIIGPYNPKSETVRNPTSKWFLSCEEYPFEMLPPYMSGSGYILTQDLVRDLSIMSSYVPLIHIDDLYVTGILGRILHVEYAYSAGGFIYAGLTPPTLNNMVRDDVYTRAMADPQVVRTLWKDLETYKPPSRLRAEALVLMFFAIVFVGFCFACMCALEMDNIHPHMGNRQPIYYHRHSGGRIVKYAR